MKRKAIQIAAAQIENNWQTQSHVMIYALCDDGTVWEKADTREGWYQLDEIPQDEEKA